MTVNDEAGCHGRAEEFLQVFKKGAEFTQDLMKENERLRYRILQLENMGSGGPTSLISEEKYRELVRRIEELEREKRDILDRIRQVEEENQDFATRYVEIESENNNLANLYIASYQLHSTLDFREVLQIITEIVINLIGAEEFAIMLLDEKTGALEAVACEGLDRDEISPVALDSGIIGQVTRSGENYFVADVSAGSKDLSQPVVCIPLKIKDHVI